MSWNPWKLTTIAMGLVMATALVTGLVVANWTGSDLEHKAAAPTVTAPVENPPHATAPPRAQAVAPRPTAPARVASSHQASQAPAMSIETASAECNRYAANQAGPRDKTTEVVKDTAIGAIVGAAVGAAGGAIANGGKGAGKGAAIGGLVGGGGGTLYGLNDNHKHDENYRAAYATCMRSHGFIS